MKVFAISDLHLSYDNKKSMEVFGGNFVNYLNEIKNCWQQNVTENDVVIVAGDISWAMKLDEAKKDFEFFENLSGKKIFVRGNHDYWWSSISNVRNMLPDNCFALQNDAIKFENYVFCGTRGWILPDDKNFKEEDEKIYKRELIRLEMALKSANDIAKTGDEIVCVLHFPPFNQDKAYNDIVDLLVKHNVKKCVFGHIHCKKGKYEINENVFGIDFYLSSCDIIFNKLLKLN